MHLLVSGKKCLKADNKPMDNNAVAPHAGAWIETRKWILSRMNPKVAPHAGAWIETHLHLFKLNFNNVAPHAGAWIETDKHNQRLH